MYKIADFNIDFKNQYPHFPHIANKYLTSSVNADVVFAHNISELQIENCGLKKFSNAYLEEVFFQRKIAEWLPLHNAFVLHSACFDVDGIGVAFAAHSGTGKTTHLRLWYKLFNNKMLVVNGDKPIVRFFDDEPETPYAYGTPWNGKEHLGCNMRTKLQHICFIERSETNFVEPMNKEDAIERIFNQVYMPKDPVAVVNTMQLIDRLLSCCKLWKIHCNMEPEAAEIAYDAIFNS